MRNILQNVNSSKELLSRYNNEPRQLQQREDLLNIIKDQVKRGNELISNVEKLAKMDESNVILNELNARVILDDAIEFVRKSFSQKDITIDVSAPYKEIVVHANEFLIDIFENILTNAVLYTDVSRVEIEIKISIEHLKENHFIKFEFMDNGRGISDNMKELIFQKGHVKEKRSKGMGLGLSLVSKIMDSYHGHARVKDRVEGDYMKGSNFILLIPEVKNH